MKKVILYVVLGLLMLFAIVAVAVFASASSPAVYVATRDAANTQANSYSVGVAVAEGDIYSGNSHVTAHYDVGRLFILTGKQKGDRCEIVEETTRLTLRRWVDCAAVERFEP